MNATAHYMMDASSSVCGSLVCKEIFLDVLLEVCFFFLGRFSLAQAKSRCAKTSSNQQNLRVSSFLLLCFSDCLPCYLRIPPVTSGGYLLLPGLNQTLWGPLLDETLLQRTRRRRRKHLSHQLLISGINHVWPSEQGHENLQQNCKI